MIDTIPPNTTAYEIPLTDRQLIHLGRITATWAQVEFFIDRLLMLALDLNPPDFDEIYSAKMVGTRIDHLDAASKELPEGDRRKAVGAFVVAVNRVKKDRNHAIHGVWGFRVRGHRSFPAARHRKTPSTPLRAERLKRLECDVARASLAGAHAIAVWTDITFIVPTRLNFGASETPPARLGAGFVSVSSGRPTQGHT